VIELHAHSTASDGALSPTQLVSLAHSEGLSALALTDHDTVAGLDEAKRAADTREITFVAGIELEVDFPRGTFHLLGLGLDHWHGRHRKRLEQSLRYRKERNLAMVEQMQQAGIDIEYKELADLAGHDTVGRPHFAALLLKKGVISKLHEAYDGFIGNGKRFYVQKRSPDVGAACAVIHAAGGVAVLAHPHTLGLDWDELGTALKRWKGQGLDGVEAYNATTPVEEGHRYAAVADELGLVTTAGSDFHTPYGGNRRLGRGPGDQPIEDTFLNDLMEYKRGRR
jgi:predicted metal-dependent phosphoesterase TrpH